MPKPTTTTYVILGLLALRRWSTYELARQMRRSIRYYWPRAESHLYEEPKKLVALGFATATREHVGRRPRTVYAITDEGRAALREWLATPGGFPQVEFDGLVKVLFAEQGTREQLLDTLAAVRADAQAVRAHHAELAADLLATGGPFPDRLHVNALVFAFMWEQANAVLRWARWAEDVVAAWPDTAPRPAATGPLEEAARPPG
ncbi:MULTISPECIES: PadR family transcriptional regulator [unclassified Saccharothrix]|uniref:PadR family transcriptional regulator n=1 Tax=unclassified Saccharothrix TaxID=2593673 RepID=UPI00307CD41D